MTEREDLDALAVIQQPRFWCRARLFLGLRAAQQKGVLDECLDEIEGLSGDAKNKIVEHLVMYWGDRCEHGMFRSGAGACPQCGGGAA